MNEVFDFNFIMIWFRFQPSFHSILKRFCPTKGPVVGRVRECRRRQRGQIRRRKRQKSRIITHKSIKKKLIQNWSNQIAIPSIIASTNQRAIVEVFGFYRYFAATLQKVRFLFLFFSFANYPLHSEFGQLAQHQEIQVRFFV